MIQDSFKIFEYTATTYQYASLVKKQSWIDLISFQNQPGHVDGHNRTIMY